MPKPLTVADVIEKLGGLPVVATRFKVGETAVMNWRAWNKFPQRLHLDVYLACDAAGINYDPRKVAA